MHEAIHMPYVYSPGLPLAPAWYSGQSVQETWSCGPVPLTLRNIYWRCKVTLVFDQSTS